MIHWLHARCVCSTVASSDVDAMQQVSRGPVLGSEFVAPLALLALLVLLALLRLVPGALSSVTTFGAFLRPAPRHCDCFCENGSSRCSPTLPELDCSTSCTSLCEADGLKAAAETVGPCSRGETSASPPVGSLRLSRSDERGGG